MNNRQVRWLITAFSSAVIAWVVIRRRQELLDALPEAMQDSIQERIILPLSNLHFREEAPTAPDAPQSDTMTRKVGNNRRISVHGKLYGPLDAELVGQQVEVAEVDGQLIVSHEGREISTFALIA